jgi:hypothetical protein
LFHWQTTVATDRADVLLERARAAGCPAVSAGVIGASAMVRDADGHAVVFTESRHR